MDRKQFDVMITKVFKSLTPHKIQTIEYADDSAKVLIVAALFDGLRLKKRFDMVWSLVESEDKNLSSQVLMSFELYSISEFKNIEDKFQKTKSQPINNQFVAESPR